MQKLSKRLANKSLEITLAALEIYNKPQCNYRDEAFTLLIINAYELLFKAKIIDDNNNNVNSIYTYTSPKNKLGQKSKKKIIKRSRIGQPLTLSIDECINILLNEKLITNNIRDNIIILIEIRDNSIHFINKENIKNKVYEVCAASIKNYSLLLMKWFPYIRVDSYNFFITPLNYDTIQKKIDVSSLKVAEKNLLNYIDLSTISSDKNDDYDLIVNVNVNFTKNSTDDALLMKYAEDGRKIDIELTDEMFNKMYPYNYNEIVNKIKNKRSNIKINSKFHSIKNKMVMNETCCKKRYLDVKNKKGMSKIFYNSNFVKKFLEIYDKE